MSVAMMEYAFTEAEFKLATDEWGANCGPGALAFATKVTLEECRKALAREGFDKKRYTNPTMMRNALFNLRVSFDAMQASKGVMFARFGISLVRVQWGGPWMAPGAHHLARYGHTHWIATAVDPDSPCMVFDVNGGLRHFKSWQDDIVPLLIPKRGDGTWEPTHIWRIRQ